MKPQLTYVHDGLCSWCYALDPVIQRIVQSHRDRLDLRIVSGGMFIGENRIRIGQIMQPGFKDGYAEVARAGNVEISDRYLDGLIGSNYLLDSERTGAALSAFRLVDPRRASSQSQNFVFALQKQIYVEGLDPNDEGFYRRLAETMALDPEVFVAAMVDDEALYDMRADFAYARALNVNAYPEVFITPDEHEYALLARGFLPEEELTRRIDIELEKIAGRT